MPAHRSHLHPRASAAELLASLSQLRRDLELPGSFPADVETEADAVARDVPVSPDAAQLPDLRDIPFLTIDPEGSTDLDQALHLERTADGGAILHYAIADVPAYVVAGGAIDAEARRRGQTMYAPDGRVSLHPEVISEGAASLLPGQDRRAFVWRFMLDAGANPVKTTLTRGIVRSRAQWSYQGAQQAVDDGTAPAELAALAWFGPQRSERESERGGASLNIPTVEIVTDERGYHLVRQAQLPIEDWNAQVSLLTGMAAADIMLRGRVGILRTMPPASPDAVADFRAQTVALGLPWRDDVPYGDYLQSLDRSDPAALAVKDAAGSLFRGAGYAAFDGEPPADPVQSAIGAPYAHTTAPLRRLVDRWSLTICEALANGRPVPEWARSSLAELPKAMGASGQRASRLDAGAIDRVEAAVLSGREGDVFDAVVLGHRGDGARMQLTHPPVDVKVAGVDAPAGAVVPLRLESADVASGTLQFAVA